MSKELMRHLCPSTLAAIAADLARMVQDNKERIELAALRDEAETVIDHCIEIERGNNGMAEFLANVMRN